MKSATACGASHRTWSTPERVLLRPSLHRDHRRDARDLGRRAALHPLDLRPLGPRPERRGPQRCPGRGSPSRACALRERPGPAGDLRDQGRPGQPVRPFRPSRPFAIAVAECGQPPIDRVHGCGRARSRPRGADGRRQCLDADPVVARAGRDGRSADRLPVHHRRADPQPGRPVHGRHPALRDRRPVLRRDPAGGDPGQPEGARDAQGHRHHHVAEGARRRPIDADRGCPHVRRGR